jgi:hypothetical protein
MPETVQGLIAARLDSLSTNDKSLLQDAAVVGRVFWIGAAMALGGGSDRRELEDRLHGLARKEFLRRERRSVVEGDTQYAFSHVLVRDVAYAQIPRADRAEKHEQAARWIEELGRPEEHADMRAHHYLSALEAAQTAGRATPALVQATRAALREAGERAAALNAYGPAARAFDRALELASDEDDDRPLLLFAAARARFDASEWNIDELTAARDALLAAGDVAKAAQAETIAARAAWMQGRGDEVVQHSEHAEELAAPLPPSAEKADVYTVLARLHWLGNRESAARRLMSQAFELADELDLPGIRAPLLSMLGTMQATQGDASGLEALERSIAIYEELGSPDAQSPYNNLADTLYRLGRIREAAEVTERMAEAQRRYPGRVDFARWKDTQEIRLRWAAGRWDDALELAERGWADLGPGGRHYLEPEWRIFRARIRLARGDHAGAKQDADAAVDRASEAGDAQILTPSLAVQARVLWSTGRTEAEDAATELLDVCRRTPLDVASDWFPEVVMAFLGLGRAADVGAIVDKLPTPTPWLDAGLALRDGKPALAAEIFAEMGALPFEAEARLLAAQTGEDAGLEGAMAFFREVGAEAHLAAAESLLASRRSA